MPGLGGKGSTESRLTAKRHLVPPVVVARHASQCESCTLLSKGDRVMVTGRLRQRSWETPEGDKRSVTEIEADEVGASLKWATAKVERTSSQPHSVLCR
jgi:single-stranded DNA-binding protein